MTWLDIPKATGFYWAIWITGAPPEIAYYNADLDDIETYGEDDGYSASEFSLFWGPLEPPDLPEG